MDQTDVELYKSFQRSPILFIEKVWGLVPERDNSKFIKGKHITWQQHDLLLKVEEALKEGKKRISVRSGHGVGKSTTLSWLILWFLFCYKDAQIPCTAPTSDQMHDVLWKEVSKWLQLMPKGIKEKYDWSSNYVRITESPETWFARAKTARKESPEALAGVHGEYVLFLIDEACHDDKTEILTENGWKRFDELSKKEPVMTLNTDGNGEFQTPTAYQKYDFNGELNGISSKTGDFCITDNHNIWAKTKKAGYRKIAIKDIPNSDYYIPRVIRWTGKETISEDMMEFWGWFLSEGCLQKVKGKNYSVVISQDIKENRNEIIALVQRLGYKPSVYEHSISVHSRELCRYCEERVDEGFKYKFIPKEIKNQSPRLLNIFLDSFSKGDGYKKGNREILYTSSPRLADDLQEVVLKTGKNSTLTKRKINGQRKWIKDHWATSSCDGYVVSRSHIDTHLKINRKKITKIPYSGKVYCVTVPNGIVMTRRNGKSMWSGNSGVPEEIFNTAEGALTDKQAIVIMISNATRLIGYFYDSHHKDKDNWETLHFNSIESPIVDTEFVERIKSKHGEDSDEYAIRVKGEFPKEEAMDEAGYIPLYIKDDLKFTDNEQFIGDLKLGVDPAGEGNDKTIWVARDNFKAKIIAKERVSNSKSIAQKTLTLMSYYSVRPENVAVDNFGEGANVAQEMGLSGIRVSAVNVGNRPLQDEGLFLNLRAYAYWKQREWIKRGGELVTNDGWEDMLSIRHRKELSGKMKIMGKVEMKKKGYSSPDHADALMLTFIDPEFINEAELKTRY